MGFRNWLFTDLATLINQGFSKMSAELDRLKQEVTETTTVARSAVALIQALSQRIRDNVNDPAALTALSDELDAAQSELGAAVAANTVASDEPATDDTQG